MKPELSQAKLTNLRHQIQENDQSHDRDVKDQVDCQCGWKEVDGKMVSRFLYRQNDIDLQGQLHCHQHSLNAPFVALYNTPYAMAL